MDDLRLIDGHAHVWDRSCTFVAGARYAPAYEATIDSYLAVLDAHGIERAVLVQPSFLGTDNGYLLDCLRAHPDRLRGIVVVEPTISDAELDDLSAAGVIGHRYNLLSMDPALVVTEAYGDLTHRAMRRLWWTEVQAPGLVWPDVVAALGQAGAFVMVDHFGLPTGPGCPGIAALRSLNPACVCLKLSAPYRQHVTRYLDAVRPWLDDRQRPSLVWGSDWPWTGHEGRHGYRDCIDWLSDWTTDRDRASVSLAGIPCGFT